VLTAGNRAKKRVDDRKSFKGNGAQIQELHTRSRAKGGYIAAWQKVLRMENTRKSTYVWLPIEWEGEKPVIRWKDEWRLEDYE